MQETVVTFGNLCEREGAALLDEMFALDSTVFPGAQHIDLRHYLDDPRATEVKVILYRHKGRLVGQNIIPIIPLTINGRTVDIFTSVAGILPEFRGGMRTQLSALRLVLQRRARHPWRRTYAVMGLLQPRVYEQFANLSSRVHPRPNTPEPRAVSKVLDAFAEGDSTMVRRGACWVQQGLPVPQATVSEVTRLRSHSPLRAFYRSVVDHQTGEALVTVVPLDTRMMLVSTARLLARRQRRSSS